MLEKLKNLTKQQKLIAGVAAGLALVIIAVATVIVALAVGAGNPNTGDGGTQLEGIQTYAIELKTNGGKAFEKIEIHVFEDNTMNDLVAVGKTDANGEFSFQAEYSKNYVAVLKNMPAGYLVEDYYSFEGTNLTLALEATLLSASDVTSALKLGGVAADLTVTTADGNTYTISELLKTKEAVVLNFWFENCEPCRAEFPYMQEAYQSYSDKIEILAISTDSRDTAESVAEYKSAMGLSFPMAKADAAYTSIYGVMAAPTTVVIDRYGTIGFMHTGSVPNTDSFKALFDYFTGDDYVQSTVRNLDDIVSKVEGGDGSKAYPFEEYRTEFNVEIQANKEVYYQMYRVDGMLFEIHDADAYVIFEDKKYEAVDGRVSVILKTADTYTPAVFVIGNKSAEKKSFAAKLSFLEGTSGNPYVMNLGVFTAKVEAGNEKGIYYTYTATENGTLRLQCTGVTAGAKYDFSLYNTTTYAMRTYSSDADGDGTVEIAVNAADVVQISVGVLPNEDNEIPPTDFNFKASFEQGAGTGVDPDAKVEFTVTIVDQKGNGVVGVVVKFTDDITATTDSSGVAMASLANGNYVVKLVAPNGYKEDTTEYIMTKNSNTLNVTMEKTEIVNKTYTVTVVDEDGKKIVGAGVTVGGVYVKTDSTGVATYVLEEASYTASVVATGYESASKKFGNATEITVTMKKETETVKTVAYTVSVYRILDNKQSNLKNVKVVFMSGDAVVAEATTNDSGQVVANLKEGNYTVKVSDGTYGSGVATLTAKNNSVSLFAAKSLDMSVTTEICEQQVVTIKSGATGHHAAIKVSGNTYFRFAPTKSGKYEIKVSGDGAKVTYCGGEHNLQTPQYSSDTYEFNVDDSQAANEVAYIFSATGATDTVISVVRTGDAEAEKTYTDYVGSHTPSSTNNGIPTSETQKWVDVTGTFTIVRDDKGFYHKDEVSGPMIYVTLGGSGVQFISMEDLLSNGPLRNAELMEDYTNLMQSYVDCMNEDYGTYPLTDDLIYMYKMGGDAKGWYEKGTTAGFYLFGNESVNEEIAWMFECCYWE